MDIFGGRRYSAHHTHLTIRVRFQPEDECWASQRNYPPGCLVWNDEEVTAMWISSRGMQVQ